MKRGWIVLMVLWSLGMQAQDDLMDLLEEENEPQIEYAYATFKGTRVINGQSNEIPGAGVLQFVFQHRFGSLSDDFFYNFFGLDNADVRLSLDYSFNDWLNVGVGRSSFQKTYDGSIKAKILRQSSGARTMPISMTAFASAFINSLKYTDGLPHQFSDRLSYSYQLIIARKFNDDFSFAVTPSLVHFNLVDTRDQPNDVVTVGLSGRYKLNQRVSVNVEYFPQIVQNFRTENGESVNYNNSLSLGFDIETGGHVFQLFFSNSRGVIDPQFMAQTPGSWADGDVFFGFNISRVFTLVKPKMPEAAF